MKKKERKRSFLRYGMTMFALLLGMAGCGTQRGEATGGIETLTGRPGITADHKATATPHSFLYFLHICS